MINLFNVLNSLFPEKNMFCLSDSNNLYSCFPHSTGDTTGLLAWGSSELIVHHATFFLMSSLKSWISDSCCDKKQVQETFEQHDFQLIYAFFSINTCTICTWGWESMDTEARLHTLIYPIFTQGTWASANFSLRGQLGGWGGGGGVSWDQHPVDMKGHKFLALMNMTDRQR